MLVAQVVQGAHDLKVRIESEKCFEKILLVPQDRCIDHPGFWVIARREDIVYMNEYTRPQARQDRLIYEEDVPLRANNVGGIDEQDVIFTQAFK